MAQRRSAKAQVNERKKHVLVRIIETEWLTDLKYFYSFCAGRQDKEIYKHELITTLLKNKDYLEDMGFRVTFPYTVFWFSNFGYLW